MTLRVQSYTLREVINLADGFVFGSDEDMHEMSSLYEDKINRMGNAGRNGGEYYTPRPLIRAMIKPSTRKSGTPSTTVRRLRRFPMKRTPTC